MLVVWNDKLEVSWHDFAQFETVRAGRLWDEEAKDGRKIHKGRQNTQLQQRLNFTGFIEHICLIRIPKRVLDQHWKLVRNCVSFWEQILPTTEEDLRIRVPHTARLTPRPIACTSSLTEIDGSETSNSLTAAFETILRYNETGWRHPRSFRSLRHQSILIDLR